MSFSLYIHIPWCQSKCPYCDFNSHAASTWPEAEYTRALIIEMTRRAHDSAWADDRVKTIFFGGGTPSLFEPRSIAHVIDAADRVFGVESDCEVTLEANPGTVSYAKLAGMRSAGVNRLSFGAQSFKPAILKFLGRIHSAEQTREAARIAHRAGFERLNLDLIFATEMKRGRITPLESDEQAAMFAAVREELPRRGYEMYEISNYAPRGHEARHNLTYWRGESYLGLGAGAHSFERKGAGGRRWWNERSPARYVERALETNLAEAGDETVDKGTAEGEFVFLNLRLIDGFALDDYERRFGESFENVFGRRAARLFEGGLLVRDGGRIRLSDRGLELADSVFAEFV